MPTTENAPKCFAEIGGVRIIDWIVRALRDGGVDDICFVGGYRMDAVQVAYPDFTFRHNPQWPDNNILVSLMYAEDLMDRPFIISYSDILYSADIVSGLVKASGDIVLGIDTDWREHYRSRTQHPPHDAEKAITRDGRVLRLHRAIPYEDATGEFIGVAKFSAAGARAFREHYHRRRATHWDRPWREAPVFQKAYLIHQIQDMIEDGHVVHNVDTPGRYREIDTQEDMELAQRLWTP